ncbi:hypothetical protein [Comamonas sp. GB3 AK4-5]|uniref:hypothetical protein n=1 Tax=Comamonas sp. GB3 AK4-5 TaxID=3231487 RepID=UPI00351F577A
MRCQSMASQGAAVKISAKYGADAAYINTDSYQLMSIMPPRQHMAAPAPRHGYEYHRGPYTNRYSKLVKRKNSIIKVS